MPMQRIIVLCAALLCGSNCLAQTPAQPPVKTAEVAEPAPVAAEPLENGNWFPAASCRAWISTDYTVNCFQAAVLPPLITTSAAGTPKAKAGVLGLASTATVFGANDVNDEVRSGWRLQGGMWLDDEHTLGIEMGGMIIESQATLFTANSKDFASGILARPFFNVTTGKEDSVVVAFPGNSTGTIDVRAASGNLYEAHVDLTEKFYDEHWVRLCSLFGYRFYRYDEGLHVRQTLVPTNPAAIPGTVAVTDDDFTTHNTFNGVDIGLRGQFFWQDWSLDVLGKVAVGHVNRRINIQGQQVVTTPGVAPTVDAAGVLALSSNSGVHDNGDWTVVPEFGLNLCWHIRPYLCLRLGYTVFWLDDIARAGDQVNLSINPALFPPATAGATPTQPSFMLGRRDMWVQSINLGLEFDF
jgi:hypothetical protein